MRKVNSKVSILVQQQQQLQPNGISPQQNKTVSMINHYKTKNPKPNSFSRTAAVSLQPSAFISKTIISKRQNMNVQPQTLAECKSARNPTIEQNISVQIMNTLKILSPTETTSRKKEANLFNQTMFPGKSPASFNRVVQMQFIGPEKSKSATKQGTFIQIINQTAYNSVLNQAKMIQNQKLNKNASANALSTYNRDVIRRGSKNNHYQNQNQNYDSKSNLFKNTFALSRNKSDFVSLNQTQKINNKTQIDFSLQQRLAKEISPCVSSDEEKEGIDEEAKTVKNYRTHAFNTTTINANSKGKNNNLHIPHGSFIDNKMKNCLQARNTGQDNQSFATVQQKTANITMSKIDPKKVPLSNTAKQILTKHQSQPQLLATHTSSNNHVPQSKKQNGLTKITYPSAKNQYPTFTTVSTQRGTVQNKSPSIMRKDEQSTSKGSHSRPESIRKAYNIQGGDLKSLDLSPIEISANYNSVGRKKYEQGKDLVQKKLDLRSAGQSMQQAQLKTQSSETTSINKNDKQAPKKGCAIISNKQDQSRNRKDDPSTEKKRNDIKSQAIKQISYKKIFQSSETEKAIGGNTHSYSTAEDFNLYNNMHPNNNNTKKQNENKENEFKLRIMNNTCNRYQQPQQQAFNMLTTQNPAVIQNTSNLLINPRQETLIKVNQILNNNNIMNNQRYNINTYQDYTPSSGSFITTTNQQQTQQNNITTLNKTPKAIPTFNQDTANKQFQNFFFDKNKEDEKTAKKQNIIRKYNNNQNEDADDIELMQVTRKNPKFINDSQDDDNQNLNQKYNDYIRSSQKKTKTRDPLSIKKQQQQNRQLLDSFEKADIEDDDEGDFLDSNDFDEFQEQDQYVSKNSKNKNDYEMVSNFANQTKQTNPTGSLKGQIGEMKQKQLDQLIQDYHKKKENRDSTVNYDTSLLTHNTQRGETFNSPFSDSKFQNINEHTTNKKPHQPVPQNKFIADDYITNEGTQENNGSVSYMMQNTDEEGLEGNCQRKDQIDQTYADIQSEDFNELADTFAPLKGRRKDKKQNSLLAKDNGVFKDFIKQVQLEEEETIIQMKKQVLSSIKYKQMSQQDREKYLQHQIMKVRKQFKEIMIEKIVSQVKNV